MYLDGRAYEYIPRRYEYVYIRRIYFVRRSTKIGSPSFELSLFVFFFFFIRSSRTERAPPTFLFPPRWTKEESLSQERERIKIAGAISRTHDIGENAAEALIMADTRRGSRYHVLPP